MTDADAHNHSSHNRRPFYYSLSLHGLLLLLLIFGIPLLPSKELDTESHIVVDIVPNMKTNAIRDQAPAPKPKQQAVEKPKEEPKKEEKPTPPPPEKKELKTSKPKQAEAKDELAAKDQPLKEDEVALPKPKDKQDKAKDKKKQEPAKKPKEEQDSTPSPLANVKPKTKPTPPAPTEESAKKEKQSEPKPSFEDVLKSVKSFEESQPPLQLADELSVTEVTFIRSLINEQVGANWNVDGGAQNAEETKVALHLTLSEDGTITSVSILDKLRYHSDNIYYAAASRAVRAVKATDRIVGLPADKYEAWKEMDMVFDPSAMFR